MRLMPFNHPVSQRPTDANNQYRPSRGNIVFRRTSPIGKWRAAGRGPTGIAATTAGGAVLMGLNSATHTPCRSRRNGGGFDDLAQDGGGRVVAAALTEPAGQDAVGQHGRG